jgi:1,4-alpha-glucan branching enzyme
VTADGARRPPRRRGQLALVLHTHMPYVEGYGTWPFGEEWLWELIATSYLPVLDVLEQAPGRVTLSVTPVLADQLVAPGALRRCLHFLRVVRAETHRRDVATARAAGEREAAAALEASAAGYAEAADRLAGLGADGLLGALRPHVRFTSAATHAVLPLLPTEAGVRLQLQTGIAAHRARFGAWTGGLWLPECAHAPWLDPLLAEAGVAATCLDLTDVLGGSGDPRHLRPLRSPAGPLLVPLDRATIDLVWGAGGYPSAGPYRDHWRLTAHHHRAWANDGAVYDPARAAAQAVADGIDFVRRVRARLDEAGGGLVVCAVDTELLGHWWWEGPIWLAAVLSQAPRHGLPIVPLDQAVARHAPAPAPADLPATSWGAGRDLSTWSTGPAAELAWRARAGELRALAARDRLTPAAVRELLALQASDWAFAATHGWALPYVRARSEGHAAALAAALEDPAAPGPRHLAPMATPAPLLEP